MVKNTNQGVYSAGAGRFLAPYAAAPEKSRGRLHPEREAEGRSCFQRDRDRIIHCTAFRRLEAKTQVFVYYEGDHYRTRLTHSLEVAQLTRDICRELQLDEDLGETIALAHDMGHTPFGHAGEDALSEAMKKFGSFDHNAQTIRIVSRLESKYAAFDGLNLTWETLEGIAKHNGPVKKAPRALLEYNKKHDLKLSTYASLEAQIASFCDDIAYNNHDIEDGVRAGLFPLDAIRELPLIGASLKEVEKHHPDIPKRRLVYEAKRRAIHIMVRDLVEQTQKNIAKAKPASIDDVRNLKRPLAGFSEKMVKESAVVKAFLNERMYHHYKVNRMTKKAHQVVKDLFTAFHTRPDCLPTHWRQEVEAARDETARAIIVADFIAGMTDRFAFEEHKRIFDLSYRLIGDE